ncbi:EG45-like domain containing protein isoform X2 [Diospyros lotus]|uniref:EG45-like domain containing protein isoform X2 n=1 Tax=Diospyros lotus TaxID=55363 RepID=UPI002252FA01|nr:EG45-like domain containing protein isoform X2 [Diospyros lotus]
MPRAQAVLQWLPLLLLMLAKLPRPSNGDVSTAAQYAPPYTPTACYGNDPSQFPSNNQFAAAGDEIWDNGAACGRQYLVRCISASEPYGCVIGQTIQIRIVDYGPTAVSPPSISGTAMVLSQTAFGIIANSSAPFINIEFQHNILSINRSGDNLPRNFAPTPCRV